MAQNTPSSMYFGQRAKRSASTSFTRCSNRITCRSCHAFRRRRLPSSSRPLGPALARSSSWWSRKMPYSSLLRTASTYSSVIPYADISRVISLSICTFLVVVALCTVCIVAVALLVALCAVWATVVVTDDTVSLNCLPASSSVPRDACLSAIYSRRFFEWLVALSTAL